MSRKKIFIHAGWENDALIGTVFADNVRGKEAYSFEYHEDWLIHHGNLVLDPDILPFSGRQYLQGKETYGFLQDISPDRWGRKLIQRKRIIKDGKTGSILPSDYYLEINDFVRSGGIRIKTEENGEFAGRSDVLPVPPITSLRELEQAVRGFERADKDEEKWLNTLLAPGSSLGGARPKANVVDRDGNLWIAKFPSKNDDRNISAWEMTVHDLAVACQLDTPEAMYKEIDGRGVFLSKRFDREGTKRIHTASAMTMLGLTDGTEEGDYLSVAEFIRANCSRANENMEELWKRMVFSVIVNNTDDHLRNHSFILKNNDWTLSPVYDVNPDPDPAISMPIDSGKAEKNIQNLLEYAGFFHLSGPRAREYLAFAAATVERLWEKCADNYGIAKAEQRETGRVFNAILKELSTLL